MKLFMAIRYGNHISNEANDRDTLIFVKALSPERAKELADQEVSIKYSSPVISNKCVEVREIAQISEENEEGVVCDALIQYPHDLSILSVETFFFN